MMAGQTDDATPYMMSAIKDRLEKLVGAPSGYVASLPEPVQRRLHALKQLHTKVNQVELDFRREVNALEKRFLDEKYRPLFEKRAAILQGREEPTEEQLQGFVSQATITELNEDGSSKNAADVKGIPEFWLTAMKTNNVLADMITESDEEALRHLQDIQLHYLDGRPGFRLDFYFNENPYFTNTLLSKTYFLQEPENVDENEGDYVYDHAEGTEIQWKQDKNLCYAIVVKTQRKKGTNKTRQQKTKQRLDSFFHFFSPPQPSQDEDEDDEEEIDEETGLTRSEQIMEELHADYELGEDFKLDIIPKAVLWFTGEALQYRDEEEEGEFDEEEDFEEDDEEEEDDDDEEEDAPRPQRRAAPPQNRGGPRGAAGQQQPECNQQ